MMNYSKSTSLLIFWSLFVIGLGGFTRLMDAGLGCPDWPACYGNWIPDHTALSGLSSAAYLEAWIEMIHRYAAGLLGCGILMRAITLARKNRILLACFLLIALCLQAALGMWTVTLKLQPIVVSSHFFGAMLLVTLLAKSDIEKKNSWQPATDVHRSLYILTAIYILQLILGVLVSTNYAALSCPYPFFCPSASFRAFSSALSSLPEQLYDHSPLSWFSIPEKASLQWAHHLNALILLVRTWITRNQIYKNHVELYSIKLLLDLLGLSILIQIFIGISLVFFKLPLFLAVIHNLSAAIIGTFFILIHLSIGTKQKGSYEHTLV